MAAVDEDGRSVILALAFSSMQYRVAFSLEFCNIPNRTLEYCIFKLHEK